jgi:hypothetical protein
MKPIAGLRTFGRRNTFVAAWITVRGCKRIPCKVTYHSADAALLECEPPKWLPFRFNLQFETKEPARICEVRRICSDGVEVNFVEPEPVQKGQPTTIEIDQVEAWRGNPRPKER